MKNVVDWTAKDAQNFLASYNNSFDKFIYKGFLVSYNSLTNRWRAFNDHTWQPLAIDFANPNEARLHIDDKNI